MLKFHRRQIRISTEPVAQVSIRPCHHYPDDYDDDDEEEEEDDDEEEEDDDDGVEHTTYFWLVPLFTILGCAWTFGPLDPSVCWATTLMGLQTALTLQQRTKKGL